MKICDDCNNGIDAELLRAEWYYERKLNEAKTLEEMQATVLFWHCTNEQIKYKYKEHERSLGYGSAAGKGKANTSQNLQR